MRINLNHTPFLKRFFLNQRGSVVVETLFVSIPLIYLLLLVFEFSLIFYTQAGLTTSLINTSRQIETGRYQIALNTQNPDQFKNFFCNIAKEFPINCNLVTVNFTRVTANNNGNSPANASNLIAPSTTILVRVDYNRPYSVPLLKYLIGGGKNYFSLTSANLFRIEDY